MSIEHASGAEQQRVAERPALVELSCAPVRARLGGALREALGLDTRAAAATVEHLLRSEQAGKDCHGLIRVRYLLRSGKFGPFGGRPAPEPSPAGPARLHVDGAGHLGYPVMDAVIRAGCAVAIREGHCLVTGGAVYPSGCLGDWARLAAEQGVATVLTAGSPPRVAAPGGGARPVVGTNPLCVGVPALPLAFVCDASTSAITHGDLLLARDAGRPIPADSAVDADGQPTRDPGALDPSRGLGALLAVGNSHKSFAISMAVELLTSLGGGTPGSAALDQHGIFALFIGPEVLAATRERMSRWLVEADDAGTRVPGWASGRRFEAQRARDVVQVSKDTLEALEPWLDTRQA